MEYGEFHHKNGWFFSRREDGTVQIRIMTPNEPIIHAIAPAEWASIIAHVAGGDAAKFAEAERFHGVRLGA